LFYNPFYLILLRYELPLALVDKIDGKKMALAKIKKQIFQNSFS
jgi:hypothetical protein